MNRDKELILDFIAGMILGAVVAAIIVYAILSIIEYPILILAAIVSTLSIWAFMRFMES